MSSLKKAVKRARKRNRTKRSITNINYIEVKADIIYPFDDWEIFCTELRKIDPNILIDDYHKLFIEKVVSSPLWKEGDDYKKGLISEFYVDVALSLLTKGKILNGYFMTARRRKLDHQKIDAMLSIVGMQHFWLPLQVKSSRYGQQKHFYDRDIKDIPSVIATPYLSELVLKIKTIISFKLQSNEIVHT